MKQVTTFVLLLVAILFLYLFESPWWGYCIVIVIIMGAAGGSKRKQSIKVADEMDLKRLQLQGIMTDNFINTGNYIGGHPDLNIFLNDVILYKNSNDFEIYIKNVDESDVSNVKVTYLKRAIIPVSAIKNILLEDKSTIDKRMSVGKAILFGPLALGMQKTVKKEEAYLNISWNDGKYDHETLFQFPNLQQANIARNELIKATRQDNGQS